MLSAYKTHANYALKVAPSNHVMVRLALIVLVCPTVPRCRLIVTTALHIQPTWLALHRCVWGIMRAPPTRASFVKIMRTEACLVSLVLQSEVLLHELHEFLAAS